MKKHRKAMRFRICRNGPVHPGKKGDYYYLFRNRVYGAQNLNTQYASPIRLISEWEKTGSGPALPVAAPKIVCYEKKYYIAALNPGLNGIRVAKLNWKPKTL